MKRIIAILDLPERQSTSDLYKKYHLKIDELMADPNVHFIFSDASLFVAKYLQKTGFRSCTVYHIGDEPKHKIGNFKTKGKFTSIIELREALRQDCSEILDSVL